LGGLIRVKARKEQHASPRRDQEGEHPEVDFGNHKLHFNEQVLVIHRRPGPTKHPASFRLIRPKVTLWEDKP
jgi:hypothetical protein